IHWSVGQLVIAEGSSIDVTGRGQIGSGTTRDGGSHGGPGGGRALDDTLGDFKQPMTFGTSTNGSNRGGGIARINAAELQLTGAIIAGGPQAPSSYGGGSGGSVWLTVGELSGGGRITANGGPGGSNVSGSGGGGGRIAVYYQSNDGFPIENIQALGGLATSTSYDGGGVGSIYVKDTANETSMLRFVGLGMSDSLSFLDGQVPDGSTVEVIDTRVVLAGVDSEPSGDSSGANRHIRVDGGYLSFRPVLRERPPSRWETVTLENEAVVSHNGVSTDNATSHTGIRWSVGQLIIGEGSS